MSDDRDSSAFLDWLPASSGARSPRLASSLTPLPRSLLYPGEKLILPEFRLSPAATTTNIQVSVSQLEIATEQLQVQEQQRVLGIFPNFYSSYIWDAAPLSAGQKYQLAVHSLVDPSLLWERAFLLPPNSGKIPFPAMVRARKATPSDMALPMLTRR